jgi:flagella basal body P-ring formation protein FlgA
MALWNWIMIAAAVGGPCLEVEGEHIRALDLAKANPVFASLPPNEPISLTPYPGADRIIRPEELVRLAVKHGLQPGAWEPVCFRYRVSPIDPEKLLAALRLSLGSSEEAITLMDYSRWAMPQGTFEFPGARTARPDASGTAYYRGVVKYATRRTVPVWAKVRVEIKRPHVVAVEALSPGVAITPEQVRLDTGMVRDNLVNPIADVSLVIGKTPKRNVAAGSALTAALLQEPRLVEPGDTIHVEARSGAARLSLSARAESGGRMGDRIVVKNPSSGKRFSARIEGPGRAVAEN